MDVMEGEEIELIMSRQATAGAHQSKHTVQKVLVYVVTEIQPHTMIQTSNVCTCSDREGLVARKTMTTGALRFG